MHIGVFASIFLVAACVLSLAETDDGKGVDFGSVARRFATMSEFSNEVAVLTTPMLLTVFDTTTSDHVSAVWAPLVRSLSTNLYAYGITVGYAFTNSDVGKGLSSMMPSSSAILFFNGLLIPMEEDASSAGKVPLSYAGVVEEGAILRWVFESLSPECIERIENGNDLVDLFAKLPAYDHLPRIMYFTAMDYVSPLYYVLSQKYQYDGVFGVVVDAFGAESRRDVAVRYNITSVADLPAILVLHRAEDDKNADEVHRMPRLGKESLFDQVDAFLKSELPNNVAQLQEEVRISGRQPSVEVASELQRRRGYIIQQLQAERRVAATHVDEEDVPAPIVVHTQTDWEKECIRLPKGQQCLVAFVETGDNSEAYAMSVLQDTGKRIAPRVRAVMGDSQRLHLVVIDAWRNPAVSEYFGAGQNGFPDVVLLNPGTRSYYPFIGSFTADRLVLFYGNKLDSAIASGRRPFIPRMVPSLEQRKSGNDPSEDSGDL